MQKTGAVGGRGAALRNMFDAVRVRRRYLAALGFLSLLWGPGLHAQLSVDGGTPSYLYPIAVPPGVAGMAPTLSLAYSASVVNGPVGFGWSLRGLSLISRCAATKAVDGRRSGVNFNAADKLCLDGQRLIQTDESGSTTASTNAAGVQVNGQTNDSQGLSQGAYREYRTEKDSFARIRAYGNFNSNDPTGASGPAFFKVWTKSGQIYEYGAGPSTGGNPQAVIKAYGKTVASAWALARVSDTSGNFVDFKYDQNSVAWGSGPSAGNPTMGNEWNIREIQYSGNKVIFTYVTRTADASEAYHQGSKVVSTQLLRSITTYVNAGDKANLGPGSGIAVRTVNLSYDNGPITKRARLRTIQDCAGDANSSRCLPATRFTYSDGGDDRYQASSTFAQSSMSTTALSGVSTTYGYGATLGVLTGDFDGDGRTDFIRWTDDGNSNQLWLSNGNGSFRQVATGSGAGQFNITDHLFTSDQCFFAIAADFNGDGITDVLRVMRPWSGAASSCGTQVNKLFLANGDGSFRSITLSSNIDLTQFASKATVYYDCAQPRSSTYISNCNEWGDTWLGTGRTQGQTFHVLDVDGDGILDLVTTVLPGFGQTTTIPTSDQLCASTVCTHVYLGKGDGTFTEVADTNLAHHTVYTAPPGKYNEFFRRPFVADANGDGLQDILVDSGAWLSNGDGNFTYGGLLPNSANCAYPIDFNGDGRADCLNVNTIASQQSLTVGDGTYTPSTTGTFNLMSTGQELVGTTPGQIQNIGSILLDSNGDGRQDILRWEEAAANNVLYLSNGDGTFTPSTSFNLGGAAPVRFQSVDGVSSFVEGDFTGHGTMEFLLIQTPPPPTPPNTQPTPPNNQLYVRVDSSPPDQLLSVTTGGGATTQLRYVPLTSSLPDNDLSGSFGQRYSIDRGTANAASGSTVDVIAPMYVVATTASDSGPGTPVVRTEFSYAGLKADTRGRGSLGFREIRRQTPGADGSPLTTLTQYLQVQPYIGAVSRNETYANFLNAVGAGNSTGSLQLSSTVNVYCDQASGADPTVAGEATPCGTSPLAPLPILYKPYLYKSTETSNDYDGTPLPQVVTQTSVNGSGDPLTISMTTTGSSLGLSQTFTKTTTNQYLEDTSCSDPQTCSWIKGRLLRSTVANTAPNLLPSITTSAGVSPNAAAIQGSGATQVAAMTSKLAFGTVSVGSSSLLSATLANDGAAPLSITVPAASAVTGTDFSFDSTTCASSLAVGASCSITVRFTPTLIASRVGTLSVVTGGGTLTSSLSGGPNGPVATLTSARTQTSAGSYGSSTRSLTVSYRNDGNAALSLSAPTLSAPLSIASSSCSAVAPGSSCSFVVTVATNVAGVNQSQSFAPSGASTGPASSTLTWSNYTAVPRWGTASLAFGNVTVNQPSTLTVTLYNDGNAATNWSTASIFNLPAGFTFDLSGCSNVAPNGGSCSVPVTFKPTAVQAYSGGNLFVNSYSYGGSNFTMSVSGTGVATPVVTSAAFSAANVTQGGSIGFSWATSNATSVSVACSGATAGSGSGASGSLTASTSGTGTGTCIVTASNAAGTQVTASGTTNVVAPPSVTSASFSAANVTVNNSVSFNWSTSGATSAAVSCSGTTSGSGSGTSGSISFTPSALGTGTCSVTATNAAGAQASGSGSTNVVKPPSFLSALFSPNTIVAGSTSQFSWNTNDATSVVVSCAAPAVGSGSGTPAGGITVSTSGTGAGSCTAVASNAAGTQVSRFDTLTVNPPGTNLSSSPTSATWTVGANGNGFKTFTITNTGSTSASSLTISVTTNTGSGNGTFSKSGGTCAVGGSIAAGASCTVIVTYTGGCGAAGSNNGQLTVNGTSVGNAAIASLSGSYTSGVCR